MINRVFELIKENVEYYKESSNDLRIRCIYCGDSKKHPHHVHLYISKYPVRQYGTYVYHCFRAECGAKGPLIKLLSDLNLLSELTKDEIAVLLTPKLKRQYAESKEKTLPESQVYVRSNVHKLEYIKQRLGIQQIPEFIDKTIVTDFDMCRDIVKDSIIDMLNKYFVGFRTFDFCKIVCRNTLQSDFRYYNVYLREKQDFYITSPSLDNLDLLGSGTIIVAEGIFSVLNGYLKTKDFLFSGEKNIVLGACLGGKTPTFIACIRYIQSSLGIPDWNIVIFSDSEVPVKKYSDIKRIFRNVKVYYNKKGEDFGCKDVQPVLGG